MNDESNGTLLVGEVHPAVHIAIKYIRDYLFENPRLLILEALASTALSGNRLAEIANETLRRFLAKEPVSDRYLMGLAWLLHDIENQKKKTTRLIKKKVSKNDKKIT